MQEVDVGIVADLGTLQRLPKIVGNDSIVRELCYTARQMNASEAFSVGLVGFVVTCMMFAHCEMTLNEIVLQGKLIVCLRLQVLVVMCRV